MVYNIVIHIPLLTFSVWFFIGAFQIYRGRTRTLTEVSFILGSFAWAGYALADWLVFHSPDVSTASLMAHIAVAFVTVAAFFLLIFTKLFLTKASRTDSLLIVPFAGSLYLTWGGMLITDMKGGEPWGWTALFDPALFLLWLAYVIVYASVAIWYIYRTYLIVRSDSKFLGRRLFGIFISLLVTLALGLSTNTIFHALGIGLMPLFSSMLLFPGVITLYVLVPLTRERISTVMRRWKSTRYDVLGVYLVYENGTLISSKTAIQDQQVDEDIFGATLDAIQTFMRTSFPLLLGKWLRRIEHGDVKILIERGRHSYIAVIIRGEDPDTLWIKMKEAVEKFEIRNVKRLADWDGILEGLYHIQETLDDLFTDKAVFA